MTAKLLATGVAVGLHTLEGLLFQPNRPYTLCKICGEVFQSNADRDPVGVFDKQPLDFNFDLSNVHLFALGLRKEWSQKHARTHTSTEHRQLALSKRFCTPEAAQKLAPLGLVDLVGLVLDNEVASAYAESKAVPTNDVEGT